MKWLGLVAPCRWRVVGAAGCSAGNPGRDALDAASGGDADDLQGAAAPGSRRAGSRCARISARQSSARTCSTRRSTRWRPRRRRALRGPSRRPAAATVARARGSVRRRQERGDRQAEHDRRSRASTTTFPAQSGRVVFEAKVMARETAGFKAIPVHLRQQRERRRFDRVSGRQHRGAHRQHHRDGSAVRRERLVSRARRRRYRQGHLRSLRRRRAQGASVRRCARRRPRSTASATSSTARTPARCYVDNVKVYNEADYIGAPPAPRVRSARLRRRRRRHDEGHGRDPAGDRRRRRHRRLGAARRTARFLSGTLDAAQQHDVLHRFVGDAARQRRRWPIIRTQTPEHRQHPAEQLPARAALRARDDAAHDRRRRRDRRPGRLVLRRRGHAADAHLGRCCRITSRCRTCI